MGSGISSPIVVWVEALAKINFCVFNPAGSTYLGCNSSWQHKFLAARSIACLWALNSEEERPCLIGSAAYEPKAFCLHRLLYEIWQTSQQVNHGVQWNNSHLKGTINIYFFYNFVLHFRNIFLRDNFVKIGDFGISRILMSNSEVATTFVGTPYYMSPEVLKHDGYNSKSDIWLVSFVYVLWVWFLSL